MELQVVIEGEKPNIELDDAIVHFDDSYYTPVPLAIILMITPKDSEWPDDLKISMTFDGAVVLKGKDIDAVVYIKPPDGYNIYEFESTFSIDPKYDRTLRIVYAYSQGIDTCVIKGGELKNKKRVYEIEALEEEEVYAEDTPREGP